MAEPSKVLVVDDTPLNVKILADLLAFNGFAVCTASSGAEGLAKIAAEHPDLVLLDVMMPGMNGYEVCREIRANEATRMLPVLMVTALDPTKERTRGLEAGADDFLTKPINQPELLARVKSLLRIKQYHDKVQSQAAEISAWNRTLEERVQEQVSQIEQLSKLKRFFSPQLAQSILSGADELLKPHRREVTVMFLDLRGFTAFTGSAEPEEVMSVLREFHGEIGKMLQIYQGTLERFAGAVGGECILRDGKVLGVTTSGNFGHTIGKPIVYGYVPAEETAQRDFTIEVFGEPIPATRHDGALYDPKNERLKS